MSQNQAPFVVATTDPVHTNPSPVIGHSPVHSPTSPPPGSSPIIITTQIDSHRQQAMSASTMPGQQRLTMSASTVPGQQRQMMSASTVPGQQRLTMSASTVPEQQRQTMSASTMPEHERQTMSASTVPGHERQTMSASTVPGYERQAMSASTVPGHDRQTMSASTVPGHRRTGSDASQRRQKFADSPQGSVHDQVNSGDDPASPVGHSAQGSVSSGESTNQPSNQPLPLVRGTVQSAMSINGQHSPASAASNGSGEPAAVPSAGDIDDDVTSLDSSPTDELQGVELRRKQRPLRQAQSDVPITMSFLERRRCSQSLTDAKEHAYARLMAELGRAQRELLLRDEECEKLSMLRTQMEHEIDELSAALFEEANKMVQDAHVRRMNVEKRLEDANHQIDILQSEVVALKHLVVTSTPSTPNKHLHPQICEVSPKKEKSSKPFWKSHRRSTSHHEFTKEARAQAEEAQQDGSKVKEMDTVCFDEFQRWKLQPSVRDARSGFLNRIMMEDIQPCLNFSNKLLAERVLRCVQQNTLTIEPIPGDSSFPRKCSLSDMHKLCNYKIKLEEDGEWHSISQLCRNRIAAVCDFYTYIRYISQGLVKSADKDMFQEIVKLRLQMATARLGC